MTHRKGLECPVCGSPMNRHAEKIDYRGALAAAADPDSGGVLAEFHTCTNPACGTVVEQPATS